MILVVNKVTKMIEAKYEAWALGSYDKAYEDIKNNGKNAIGEEITFNGDMIIWVD